VWGVIYELEINKITKYAWGLGSTKNNQAEILAVYMGMELINVD
jgi:ribonuclease HI